MSIRFTVRTPLLLVVLGNPDYVNCFRIAYSMKVFQEGHYDGIESVIYESGFVSKTTFYKNFKKFTGKTPSQYLADLDK